MDMMEMLPRHGMPDCLAAVKEQAVGRAESVRQRHPGLQLLRQTQESESLSLRDDSERGTAVYAVTNWPVRIPESRPTPRRTRAAPGVPMPVML